MGVPERTRRAVLAALERHDFVALEAEVATARDRLRHDAEALTRFRSCAAAPR